MSSARRLPLLLVVLVVLVATGVVTSLRPATNPSVLPSGLTVSLDAESTALYCTGLSTSQGAPGRVTFLNTSTSSRALSVSIVSDKGNTYSGSIELAAHASQSIVPSALDKGDNFGVAIQISGGGVVGEEITGTNRAETPCVAAGTTHWYATGFDTRVGSSTYLSVYNPTATAAVLNASIYTVAGVSTPLAFQGFAVPAHTEAEINLGTQVVNIDNVGVSIDVLRGSLVMVGVEDSNGTISLNRGITGPSTTAWFPNVTTAQTAVAQIRVANPNALAAQVTISVSLRSYHLASQSTTVAPYSTGLVTITPNPAIPAAGYANLTLHSNEPVITTLATGTGTWRALSSPVTPGNAFLVRNFTGLGFDAVTVTNTSSRTITLQVAYLDSSGTSAYSSVASVVGSKLLAGGTTSLASFGPSTTSPKDTSTMIISASTPSLVVSLTLPSKPRGVNVVVPLDGR